MSVATRGSCSSWAELRVGAFWGRAATEGDTLRVWILDLGTSTLVIEAATRRDAGWMVGNEIQQMTDSTRFE